MDLSHSIYIIHEIDNMSLGDFKGFWMNNLWRGYLKDWSPMTLWMKTEGKYIASPEMLQALQGQSMFSQVNK